MSQTCAPIALGNACCPDRETRIFCSVKHNQVFQLSLILNCTFCLAHMFMWNVGQFFLFSCYFGYLRTIYRFTQCRLPLDNVGAWAVVGNTGVWRHFKIYWSLQLVPNGLGWKIFFFKKGGGEAVHFMNHMRLVFVPVLLWVKNYICFGFFSP